MLLLAESEKSRWRDMVFKIRQNYENVRIYKIMRIFKCYKINKMQSMEYPLFQMLKKTVDVFLTRPWLGLDHRIIRYRMRALWRDRGPIFEKIFCSYKSGMLDFPQKNRLLFTQKVLTRANFPIINPPFCGDICSIDTR